MLALATTLIRRHHVPHFVAYELVQFHPKARGAVTETYLDNLTRDLDSWWTVDAFACYLAGIVWREGQIGDDLIRRWTQSHDVWVRRSALASTIPLNNKTRGGSGDVEHTLGVCEILIADREDMIVKAMSWALRELAKKATRGGQDISGQESRAAGTARCP